MTKLFCAFAFLTALAAQIPMRTGFPFGGKAAAGPNGHVWIGGVDRIARFDAAGRTVFTTIIESDYGISAIAVDTVGRAAVTTGDTLILLDPEGRVVRTQNVGAFPAAIAMDSQGSIFLAGVARDGFIGPPGVYKPSFGEKNCFNRNFDYAFCDDAFLAKYLRDGTRAWITLFGGSSRDHATTVALDPSGAVWIAGETTSPNMPVTPNALQPVYGGGENLGPLTFGDAFLARIDATGTRLEYATFLGGSRTDIATTLTATAAGVVVGGRTDSRNFVTTPDAHRRSLASSKVEMPGLQTDVFMTAVSATGALVYSTLHGEEGPDVATAAAAGVGNEVTVAVTGNSQQCLLRLDAGKFSARCFNSDAAPPSTVVSAQGEWLAIGATKRGLPVPGVTQSGYGTVYKFGASASPVVAGVWNESYLQFRPVIAADSFISIYAAGLDKASVQLGGRELKLLHSSSTQINAYVPADTPKGTLDLTVNGRDPTPVDIVDRWPGLAGAALNQDGTVNTASNPAERGTIVSLFGSGFGPDPLPAIEPFTEAHTPNNAQGMELLFVGRIAEGLFQVNARVPQNARTGHTAVRVVFRMPSGFLFSDLARIHIR